MTYSKPTNLSPRVQARLSTYATLAGVALAAPALAPSANAAVIYVNPPDITVPNNIDGIYFNLVTGVTGTSAAAVPGYDLNPYNNGAGFTLYGAASPSGVLATGTPGTTAIAQRLTGGEIIGPTPAMGFYNQFQTVGTLFQATPGIAFVGIRFLNESTGVIDYGWVRFMTSAGSGTSLGFPASILDYAYENTGLSIFAGQMTSAVPESGETATMLSLGLLALGAVGLRRWRDDKQATA